MASSEIFNISGDIAQLCNGIEVTYFRSTKPVDMTVNVFNASSSCIMTVRLKDQRGNTIISETIHHRASALDPASVPPGQTAVVNQQKTLFAKNVYFLTISCSCDPDIGACDTTTLCSGRYEGQIVY